MNSIKISIAVVIAAIFGSALAAQAADMPVKGRSYAPVRDYMNWTGFYVGVNGGYGFGKSNWSNGIATTGDFDVKGGLAGGTIGYNYQTGSWVWGIEGDVDYSWMKGDTACAGTCTTNLTWLSTGRLRAGYAGWSNWLPYITGGVAAGSVKIENAGSATATYVGWTAGAGVEYAMWSNWSVKGEYLYTDLGKKTCETGSCTIGPAFDVSLKSHIVKLGVNYRF